VQENTRPGEEVLTSWPGYLWGTHAESVPGMENDFAPHDAADLTPERAAELRMATAADVERWIRTGRTRLVVFKLWHTLPPVPDWASAERNGYRELARVGAARVYLRER
jgi:hypothetical protein